MPESNVPPSRLPAVVGTEAFGNGMNGAAPLSQVEAEEPSGLEALRQYVGAMRRQIWVVLGIVTVCLGVAGYFAYRSEPVYRAGAVMRLTNNRQALASALGGAAMAPLAAGTPINSQIEVLRSRSVATMVVEKEGLRLQGVSRNFPYSVIENVSVAPDATADTLAFEFGAQDVAVTSQDRRIAGPYGAPLIVDGVALIVTGRPAEATATAVVISPVSAASIVQRSMDANVRDNTDVIDVTYAAPDPVRAQRIVNTLVESFRQFNSLMGQREASRRREFVERQVERTDTLLRAAQSQLTSFRQRQEVFSSRERFAARQAGVDEAESQIVQLQATQRTYRALMARLAGQSLAAQDTSLQALVADPEFASNPVVAPVFTQLVQYQTARDTLLRSGSAPTNPDLLRLNSLISSTQARLVSALRSYVESLDARLASFQSVSEQGTQAMEGLPLTEEEEVRLVSTVAYLSSIAEQLRREFHQTQMEEAIQGGEVEIVDEALPGVPVAGGKIRTVLFGLVFGLALGGGAAVLIEGLNTSIRRHREVEQLLRVPELAVIPALVAARKSGRLSLPANSRNGGGAGTAVATLAADLVAANDTQSPGAEAFRTLRTNLIFSQSIRTLRTMVVTSSAPSEGKSTTAANLAVTFAKQGLRVLLVDCDLRKARLHKVFSVPREPGFTQLVLGLADLDGVVRPTAVDGLSFLAAGTLPPNPAELVGGLQIQNVIRTLAAGYDLVLFDTPPVLAAPDAAILSRAVDGVLLVVRAGQTERDAASQAVRQLHAVGAHLFGAVLNDPDSKVGQYAGHYTYEYYGAEA